MSFEDTLDLHPFFYPFCRAETLLAVLQRLLQAGYGSNSDREHIAAECWRGCADQASRDPEEGKGHQDVQDQTGEVKAHPTPGTPVRRKAGAEACNGFHARW
jgi:hypothetical protein